jgi:murein DD-endopeptidase MepM/ murein hydrolase activator NlpD
VKDGDTVKRGDTLGTIGSTGRSTGPHLHLGLRWLGQRIDPQLLLDSPNRLPAIGESDATASAKIDAADAKEPPETDDSLHDDEG